MVKAAAGADKALIAGVSVFDLFEGASSAQARSRSAIEVTLQPTDKTLTDEEIEAIADKVIAEVKKATGGEIRSVTFADRPERAQSRTEAHSTLVSGVAVR